MNRNTGQSVAKGQEVVEEAVKRQTTGFPCLSEGSSLSFEAALLDRAVVSSYRP